MSAVLQNPTAASTASRAVTASEGQPDRVVGAIERLALSRERLRSTMMPAERKTASHPLGAGVGGFASGLADRIREMPGADMLLEAIRTWWQQHPLRTAALVAADASRKFAGPLAERNPLGLVLGAVVVGALLALSKPWRWLLRPALFAGLVPAIAARVMRQLPIESWLRMFAHVSARTARDKATDAPVARPASADGSSVQPAMPAASRSADVQRPAVSPGTPAQSAQRPSYSYGDSQPASVP
jgi:hypothetical protein